MNVNTFGAWKTVKSSTFAFKSDVGGVQGDTNDMILSSKKDVLGVHRNA